MDYEIVELDEFEVMGNEYRLYNRPEKNVKLAQKHWRNFNYTLRKNKINLGRNWLKYAFVCEKKNRLYYFIAVPKMSNVPEDFNTLTIPKSRYVKVQHTGSMNRIKNTIDQAYDNLTSKAEFNPKSFAYFEKYDYRFHWNREDSVIEILFPIL